MELRGARGVQVGDGNTQHNTTHTTHLNVNLAHADQVLHQAAPAPVAVMAALPRDVADFTGRHGELERLTRNAGAGDVVVIHTVDGMPGIGKTTLATRAAHLLAPGFPDGRLFVRLHAHTLGQAPVDPSDALAALLASRGIPPQLIPPGLDERAAMWRDHAAGRRILLVLDDASDTAQIEPLLPAAPGCLVLVTSRRRLVALDGVSPLPLDVLPPGEAALLFTRLVRRTPTPDEHTAIARAVELCGCLPLAIALLAGRLAHHPAWSITDFTEEFATAQDRLGELEAGNRAVAAAFDLSYRDLPPHRQRLFRRLGLHPGTDIDAYAVAALDGISLSLARKELRALYTDHLIDEPAPGRYRLHDLIRAYTRTHATSDPDRQQAEQRLLDYYQHTSLHADTLITRITRPHSPTLTSPTPDASPTLTTRVDGLAWLRTERPNLLAAVDHTGATHQHTRTVALIAGLTALLRQDGPWTQAIALHENAATTAHHHADPLDEANALHDLGVAYRRAGQSEAAVTALEGALSLARAVPVRLGEANALADLGAVRRMRGEYATAAALQEQAVALSREARDRLGEATALRELGIVRRLSGAYATASALQEQALVLSREIGSPVGEATVLTELGAVRRMCGDYATAAALHEQALAVYRETGDALGEAYGLYELGVVRRLQGEYDTAAALHERAVTLCREAGDRRGEAYTLHGLGAVRRLRGAYEVAAALQEQALALFRETGDRRGEAYGLCELGAVRRLQGEHDTAAALHEQALPLSQETGDRRGEANALHGLGVARGLRGEYEAATALLEQAIALSRDIGNRRGEAEALNGLGGILAETEGPPAALAAYGGALRVAREISAPLEEARALEGIARCRLRAGERARALSGLREAAATYRRLGAPEARTVTESLAELTPRQHPNGPNA